jgi:hypothetical protein
VFTLRETEENMNDSMHTIVAPSSTRLLKEALEGLRTSTGIVGKLLRHNDRADARISIDIAGKSLQYDCEIKQTIDRFSTLEDLKVRSAVDQSTILVSRPLTSALATRCHELGIQFIDTAGNAYLTDREGVLIMVTGRKSATASLDTPRDSTITPAVLRMIFGFLADPSKLNAPYREISLAVQVSTGAITNAFATLEGRGFIATRPDGTRFIRSPDLLLSEWAAGYMQRIRPKLQKYRFSAPNPHDLWHQWNPQLRMSAWGGEAAAEIITQHLNPSTFTIYMDMHDASEINELVKRFRLRADPHGQIEILQPFWNMDQFAESFPTVPLHLIYADLLGSRDSRNLKVAQDIYKRAIDHVLSAGHPEEPEAGRGTARRRLFRDRCYRKGYSNDPCFRDRRGSRDTRC